MLGSKEREINMTDTYTPPKVWTWDKASGGKFANINRPISGATSEKDLPAGKHPLQLYSLATPNGVKVAVMLEELLAKGHAGAEYDAWIINIGEGDQFTSGFVGANPNSKIPALMDHSVEGDTPQRVFESGSILMYLADKFGEFLPTDHAARTEAISWLMWQMGSAPYLGGGFGHFYAYANMNLWQATNIPSPIWRSGRGMVPWRWGFSMRPKSFYRSMNMKMSFAGRNKSENANPSNAGVASTVSGAKKKISSKSATTPLIWIKSPTKKAAQRPPFS